MRPAEFGGEGKYRAMLELAKQYPPLIVIREYGTNGLDALLNEGKREIKIAVVPEQRRLIITDNGMGMSPEKLSSLPYSIGESEKAGMLDKRGEKGLGILAFASAAPEGSVTFFSRQQNKPNYSSIRMEVQKGKRIMVDDLKEMDEKQVSGFYGVSLAHGTGVVIDQIEPNLIEKVFIIPNIRNLLSRLYTPALENGVSIRVGKFDKRGNLKTEEVQPISFSGEILNEIEREAGDDGEDHSLAINGILYFNPDGTGDKVMIYSKEVLVHGSITDIPGFEKNRFWGCGKLSGYINDNFSKLRLGRDGLDMTTRQFRLWNEHINAIEDNLREIVEDKMKKIPREKETASLHKVWDAIAGVYRNILPISDKLKQPLLIMAGVHGTEKRVIGASPLEEEVETKGGGGGGGGKGNGNGKSGGTYIEHPEGDIKKVVKKNRRFALNYPNITNFGKSESHLRSKLDTALGIPTIYINSSHIDYKTRMATGKTDEHTLRYIAYLCSKEVAHAEARIAIQQRICEPEEALRLASSKSEEINFATLSALGIK